MRIIDLIIARLEDLLHGRRSPGPDLPLPLPPLTQDEVEHRLDLAADNNPEKLNWRTSIVDLQKLIGYDPTFAGRAAAAIELDIPNYQGSAEQNIELHKRVMAEIAKRDIPIPQPQCGE